MPRSICLGALALLIACSCGSSFNEASSDAGGVDSGIGENVAHDAEIHEAMSDGESEMAAPVTLATVQSDPMAITVDDASLYWVAEEALGGVVLTVPKTGGTAVTLASLQPSILDIAVDDTTVYWSANSNAPPSALSQCLARSVKKSGGALASCVTSGVYSTTRMSLAPDSVVLLAKNASGQQFLAYSATVPNSTLHAGMIPPASALFAVANEAFVGDGIHVDDYTIPGFVMGTAVCQSDTTCGAGTIVDLVLDESGENAIWVTTEGSVVTAPAASPTRTGQLLAMVDGAPQRIARDATHAYVTSIGMGATAGWITAIALSGGARRVLAQLDCSPFGITTDGAFVYFTCNDGSVRSIRVPA